MECEIVKFDVVIVGGRSSVFFLPSNLNSSPLL
jgi:hypothetical protein